MRIPGKLLLTGLLALQVACGQPDPADQSSETEVSAPAVESLALEGTNWQLVQITVAGGFLFTPTDPGKYVLNFRSENRLTGTSDCNSINGAWQQQDNTLRFEPFSTTRSLCPPGSLHNTLALNLRDVQTFTLQDGHMILRTSTDGVTLEFASRD